METTGSSQNRKSRRTAIILASVAAAGIAGALGLGVLYGGGTSDRIDERPNVVRPSATAAKAETNTKANNGDAARRTGRGQRLRTTANRQR